MDYIDFHTHAFPDQLAPKAVAALAEKGAVTPALNGTVADLLASMDRAGIRTSVICSIATRPQQFDPILSWSTTIASQRIIPFPSFHPDDPDAAARISQIRREGFKGIKLHPYYQEFFLDDPKMRPLYARMEEYGLILVMHTGYDIGFPRDRRADPEKIAAVSKQFPDLKLVTTHLGSWQLWEDVERYLLGKPIYMDISFSLQFLALEKARKLLTEHPAEYLLFGSDSPWADQSEVIARLKELQLEEQRVYHLLEQNARQLLAGVPAPTR